MMQWNQGGQSGIYVLLQNKHRSWERNDEEKSSRGDVKEKLFSQENNTWCKCPNMDELDMLAE